MSKKKIFGRPGDNLFLHPLAQKIEAIFFFFFGRLDKISKLCSASESSKRSLVFNLEHTVFNIISVEGTLAQNYQKRELA